MSILEPPTTLPPRLAADNLDANLNAMRRSQPRLLPLIVSQSLDVEWLFGRDGSLTGRDATGRWISGCSLPARTAQQMTQKLDVTGAVACFLAPTHAAQIRAALDRLKPQQAIIALIPTAADLAAMLHCEKFTSFVESHRLWFITGDDRQCEMRRLFEDHPGLATPAQFIRVPASDSQLIERLIPEAQQVISAVTQNRADALQRLRASAWTKPQTTRLCVVAPSRFRLWNDLGDALIRAANDAFPEPHGVAGTLFDADDPTSSSPLALARAARECSAILTANTARADLSGVVPDEMPWITWVTASRIPGFSAAGNADQLILADPALTGAAYKSGWPRSRVQLATWPRVLAFDTRQPVDGPLLVAADTRRLDPPRDINEYSSHSLLWEAIRDELLRDPLAVGDDANAYLLARMQRMAIAVNGFARAPFINDLIVPSYQQGIARALMRAGLPLRLFGCGWDQIDEFASHASGPIESREQLSQILSEACAVIHVWPTRQLHPVECSGAAVARPTGSTMVDFTKRLRDRSSLNHCRTEINVPPLDGALLRAMLRAN